MMITNDEWIINEYDQNKQTNKQKLTLFYPRKNTGTRESAVTSELAHSNSVLRYTSVLCHEIQCGQTKGGDSVQEGAAFFLRLALNSPCAVYWKGSATTKCCLSLLKQTLACTRSRIHPGVRGHTPACTHKWEWGRTHTHTHAGKHKERKTKFQNHIFQGVV